MSKFSSQYLIAPNINAPALSRSVIGQDYKGMKKSTVVIEERPLTIFLNGTEIITAMTIGDYPKYLALGFLSNQRMLAIDEKVLCVDYDADLGVVVVRTNSKSHYEEKLRKKVRTSGCAVGTVFGDMMQGLEGLTLPAVALRTSWLYQLTRKINTTPSLYLHAGAVHGTVLCQQAQPLVYMEDVGRHNAVDKIAGYMVENQTPADDKILYTTGRLTSEMVIKCALMKIPTLVSRSGFTAWGVEIARSVGLRLIGRLRGRRFLCLSGSEHLIYDDDKTKNL